VYEVLIFHEGKERGMEMKRNKIFVASTIVFLLLLLGFSAALAKTLTAKSVKIGVVMPVTGPVAYDGGLAIEGIKLAAEEINAKGGINGLTKIELIIEDSRCVPVESVNAVEKLIAVDHVSAVIGDFCSSCTLADMEVAKREKVPLITPVSIAPKITQQGNIWTFRACDNTEMMANAFTKFAVQDSKIKNWAFIAVNDDNGRSSVDVFSKLVKSLGGDIVFVEYHQLGENDYYPILTKLKQTKADGLALIGELMDNVSVTKQWVELGLNKQMKLMDPTSGLLSEEFIKLTKGGCEGMIAATRFVDSLELPAAKEFVKVFQKRWGHNPYKHSQSGYDTVRIIAQAIGRAGSIEPADIREALTKTDYEGPQGNAKFDSTNQLIIDEFIVAVKDGKFVVLAGPIKTVGK
jgi:branched-chain amino acid transport system substrate-binding protein